MTSIEANTPDLQSSSLWRLFTRRNLVIFALAVVALAGGAWGFLWLNSKLKTRYSQEFLKMAEEYVSAGKIQDAVICLDSSLRMAPNNPSALRLRARIQTAQGNPEALDTWKKLMATGKGQFEDLSIFAEVAAKQQDWALAERLADAVAVTGNKAMPHLLRARLLTLKGDPSLIEKELRQAVEKDETPVSKRALAELLLSQRLNEEKSKEAFNILSELSKSQDANGAEALAVALFKGVVPAEEISAWIEAIRAHPLSSQRCLCMADYTESMRGLASHESVVARLYARVEKAPLKDRAEGMEWLVSMGKPELAANLLTPAEAQMSESSYFTWLDANSLTGNWPVVLKSLDDPNNPIKENYLLNLYKAGAFVTAGRPEDADSLFVSVYEQTQGDKQKFLKCLAFLNVSRRDALFEKGLKQLLSDTSSSVDSFKALLPSTYLRRDSAATLRYYETAAQACPQLAGDISLQNDLIYLRILMGKQQATEMAAALSQANPMDRSLRITHAFAVFKGGDQVGALQILESAEQQIAVSTLYPHEKAVVAAILTANDRRKDAEFVARMIQPNQLSLQEIQLVQSSFASQKKAEASSSSEPVSASKTKKKSK